MHVQTATGQQQIATSETAVFRGMNGPSRFPPRPNDYSPGSSLGGYSNASRGLMSPVGSAPVRGGSMSKPAMGSNEEIAQSRNVAQRHYIELYDFLTEGGQQPPPARSSAREKLTRLTRQQFQELSTDVYDELLRRRDASREPFLPVQDSFHPKRNLLRSAQQARQKLATLPDARYRDLASDVFFELERRYPEFAELGQPDEQINGPPPAQGSAANEVLVPNKSTLVEEDVGMPPPSHRKTPSPPPRSEPGRYEDREVLSDLNRSRASETSSIGGKFIGGYGQRSDSRAYDHGETEKLRSDYEYKVATLQQRVNSLEADLSDALRKAESGSSQHQARAQQAEADLRAEQQRNDDHSSTIRSLQREIDTHKDALSRQQDSRQDTDRLRRDLDDAQDAVRERDGIIDELRKEVKGLLDELRSLGARQDELMAERQKDHESLQQLAAEAHSHKQRYEAVKTELRNHKATSALFVPSPAQSDFLPASEDGAIADIHITAFQSSIDSLLVAGRSEQPTTVLSMTKQVVFAVTRLDEDITEYEARRPNDLHEEDREHLQALKAKCNATLSNLVTAARNHAASYGMSPVSLLDAAASHLSVTVVDLARLVRIRKASRDEQTEGGRPLPSPLPPAPSPPRALNNTRASSPPRPPNGQNQSPASRMDALRRASPTSSRGSPGPGPTAPLSSSVSRPREEPLDYSDGRYQHERFGSSGDPRNASPVSVTAPLAQGYNGESSRGRLGGLSPEHDRTYEDSYAGTPLDRGEGYSQDDGYFSIQNYEELREYCEQQTETIVHSIQALLAGVRSGASGEEIHANLNQIISVVTSIVGVTRDNMPQHAKREGDQILGDLTESCDKLSSMQAASHESFSKETKQKLASVSFGAAKALKALNSFLAREANDP